MAAPGRGQRFKRMSRGVAFPSSALELDPQQLQADAEHCPHLKLVLQSYSSAWLTDDAKYGHYQSVSRPAFHNQIFEGPDTDVETELHLSNLRQGPSACDSEEATNTPGRTKKLKQHLGPSPLHAYEPAFNWESERGAISGQRLPEPPPASLGSGLKVAVKVLQLKLQAGFVEPIYGSLSLYHRERREKLSEDFYFEFLPGEFCEGTVAIQRRAIFSVDAPSASICMLVQLEKHATEEGGVKSSVYSRISSPSSPLSGADAVGEGGKRLGHPIMLDVPGLNRVKECYNEDWLQDPKKKAHKPIKATLRFEVERLAPEDLDPDAASVCSSPDNQDSQVGEADGRSSDADLDNRKRRVGNVEVKQRLLPADHPLMEFRHFTKSEPFTQSIHCLYVYPLSVTFSKKRNLFIRVEVRKDDIDLQTPAMEAIYPRDAESGMREWAYSQIAVASRTAYYHDEFKMNLPAVVVGYAILPLLAGAQSMRFSDASLPILKDLVPHYLQDSVKDKIEHLEDGRALLRLRLRLCSSLYSVNERIRDFTIEFDRHILRANAPWGSELLEPINSLKNVDSTSMLQFLQPLMNMLLHLISDSGETLQVAAFRAMVNILTRVQQESSDGAERNRYLVQFIDYAFDDFGGRRPPVYPGLCNVWRGLARSKAKGYRVGPVYDDVLSMAWVFFELIVRSMALEQARLFPENLPTDEDAPPLQLTDEVFRCVSNLYDCLLTEVHDRSKKGLSLARRLNSSLAFFCYDLLSVVDPRQVFELIALYFDKFTGVCQSSLHECKLTFLQVICDHDLFIEMPGRDPSERNYLASSLMQELFLTWDHDDLSQRSKAARILVVLTCKHELDCRYQKLEDKLYISQLYFQLVGMILDEMPVFYNLNATEKREVLICVVQIIRHLDDMSLIKAWQQSVARTRLFFKLMEECLSLFEHRKMHDSLGGALPMQTPESEGAYSPKYSDTLSPAVHTFFSQASRQELKWMQPQATPENGHLWKKPSPHLNSPSQPYSLREALAHAQSSRKMASNRALRESLHPMLRQKLELWEENLSTSVSLQVLEIVEKFIDVASVHSIATDYVKLDCVTAIFTGFFSHSQPLIFWKAFFPVFNNLFTRHGATLMGRENDRFLKQIAFHLLHLAVYRNDSIRKRAVVGLQILIRVTQMKPDGSFEESGEARRLKRSLQEMASEEISDGLLKECGLPANCLDAAVDGDRDNLWRWSEVREMSVALLQALDASIEHALLGTIMTTDKYAAAESFHSLAVAYAHVPDLHIMWLLHLCDAHQEMQSWAEAAECAVAVAGVIMQALVARNDLVWGRDNLEALRRICPMLATSVEASAAEVEGYGASKLTVDSAVKYLQLGNKLFAQAELFHFCAAIVELVIPVHKSRKAYGQLAKCHTSLTAIYESIVEQESSPLPFIDATYYRVGFYGEQFGKLNRREYVYREAKDVRLGDIMEKLGHIYELVLGADQTLHIIPDSRQVKADELESGVCYLQITSVDPIFEGEDLESRKERIAARPSACSCARVFDHFLFDTPFTKNGKSQGGLEDQWKRRTVVQTHGSFPALVNRLLVIKSESREFSPIENAIGMIEARTATLRNELEEPRNSEGDHLPRLQSLQRILQGSVAVQVNSGVLGVCSAFLSGEPATKLRSQELQQLIAALLEFMAVCKRAIRIHSRLIGEEDQDFHSQLVNGFQSLTAELSHYIPAILSEL
ncbi:hypothetical protein SELMODRAFT_449303 [Selaginella moellendorffii]|uniref:DOCKER domain-containing protein n=1 Tax=Selaginella moellendorffii TaxID=88036 RepID=D8TER0_SELML|nr:hypothetical protein SELMODRAFT_449303 [Selaginella moellendorffii]